MSGHFAGDRARKSPRLARGIILLAIVVCVGFLAFMDITGGLGRWGGADRRAEDTAWCARPDERYFWPDESEGEVFGPGEELKSLGLLRVGRVSGPCKDHASRFGTLWWVKSDGDLVYRWHDHYNTGYEETPIPASVLAELPGLIRKLPFIRLPPGTINRVFVALPPGPEGGNCTVHQYPADAVPQELKDLMRAIGAKNFEKTDWKDGVG